MTTPGGDVGQAGPSSAAEPVAVARRGQDWVAGLAWGGSIVVAMVVAALATVGFQSFAPHWPAISERWRMAGVTAVESDPGLPVVEPLPGAPPVLTPETDASDAGRVITNPSWLVLPRGDFPAGARRQGIESGRVVLTCPVSAGGRIQSCWIVSETPEGAGFGEAALAGAVRGRLQPRTVDGVAVDTIISFTTRFELD